MPTVRFTANGKKYKAQVAQGFLDLTKAEQESMLYERVQPKSQFTKDLEKGPKDKGFLHTLGLLERPAQALKVGIKEAFDRDDEGFLAGAKRGLMGEEEVRTQDYLDPSLPGWYRGIVGFAGDVLTDPLTYAGGAIGKTAVGIGRGIKASTPPQAAKWLQSIKEKDVVKDMARGLNIPYGDARKVKSSGQRAAVQRERIEKELAKELPAMQDWVKKKAKQTGNSVPAVKSAFVKWLDRPVIRDEKKNILTDWDEAQELALKKEVAGTIGEDGVTYIDEWERKLAKMLQQERAAGIGVRALIMRHYFPRFITPEARELIDKKKIIEEFIPKDPFTEVEEPLLYLGKETFKKERTADPMLSVEDINMQKVSELNGTGVANPADIPHQTKFLHDDPTVAIGLRFVDHATSMQKKTFIDEITDSGKAFQVDDPMSVDPKTLAGLPPFIGVGRWMRRNPDNPDIIEQRYISGYDQRKFIEDPKTGKRTFVRDDDRVQWEWKPIEEDMSDWVSVKGIAPKFKNQEELLKRADIEQATAYGIATLPKGAAQGKGLGLTDLEALKHSNKVRQEFLKNAEVEMVFKAPKQVAKDIEQQLELMGAKSPDSPALKKFLKFYDGIQNPWKAWTLAVRPAYHTRNAIGNIFNAYIVTGLGSNIPKAIETFKDAAKLQYYSRFEGQEALRKNLYNRLTDDGKNIRSDTLKSMPKIDDSAYYADDFADTGYSMNRIENEARDRGINAGHYRKDITRDEMTNMEYELGVGKYQKWSKVLGQQSPPIKAGFAFGGTVEGNARYAIFLNTLNKIKKGEDMDWVAPDGKKVKLSDFGKDDHTYWTTDLEQVDGIWKQNRRLMTRDDAIFDIASNKVKEALFDYADLSMFERSFMKRLMPFYTWSRKNFPVQIKHLVLNPQRAEKLHLAKEQFEYDTGDITWSDIGKFWGKRVPVFLGKENAGVVKAFTLLNTIPLTELQRVMSPKDLISEMVSPIPKEIFEQLLNYDTFRDKPIAEFSYLGLGESKDFLGVDLTPRLWKLAQLIVPLGEINRLNPGGVFGEKTIDPITGEPKVEPSFIPGVAPRQSNPVDISEVARWLRFFTGFKVHDIDLNKQRYFNAKNIQGDISRLKSKLQYARAQDRNAYADKILLVIDELERQALLERR
jgi:hypothetical protein